MNGPSCMPIFNYLMILHSNKTYHDLSSFSVPNERTVVNKERAAGYYRLSAYYLAKLFSELPLVICQPTLFLIIVYWMAGLNRSEAFLTMLCCLLLTAIVGQVSKCLGDSLAGICFHKSPESFQYYHILCRNMKLNEEVSVPVKVVQFPQVSL